MHEQDIVGLVIGEAVHAAIENRDNNQLARLSRLQGLYHQLINEGLNPTRVKEIAQPLREKLGLENYVDHEREKGRRLILNTKKGPLPTIEDLKIREFTERLNLQVAQLIGDNVPLTALSPTDYTIQTPSGWRMIAVSLSTNDRSRISKSLKLYLRIGVETVGELRTVDPLTVRSRQHIAGSASILLMPAILEQRSEEPLNT